MISMVCELAAAVKAVVFGHILFEDLLCGHLSRGASRSHVVYKIALKKITPHCLN